MKHRYSSREQQVFERLRVLIESAAERQRATQEVADDAEDTEEPPSIEFAFDESVKTVMRRLAQGGSRFRNGDELLRVALDTVVDELGASVGKCQFDLEPYLEDANSSLKGVAKEIYRLSDNLRESKAAKRVYDKELPEKRDDQGASEPLFEIRELGLLDSIEGLLATPLAHTGTLDIDTIRTAFDVVGEWFPYEINVDELVYVVDDDGSVFVSTEHFPRELVARARRTLVNIATRLYA